MNKLITALVLLISLNSCTTVQVNCTQHPDSTKDWDCEDGSKVHILPIKEQPNDVRVK